jgi:hypothetical protein
MTSASKSIYFFGFYLLLIGITLLVMPNFLLSTFQLPETSEVWIRVVGILAFNIGLYYIFMAPSNHTLFMTLSVYTRLAVLIWFIAFVLIDWAPAQLLLFGLIDAAGALWTYLALKK